MPYTKNANGQLVKPSSELYYIDDLQQKKTEILLKLQAQQNAVSDAQKILTDSPPIIDSLQTELTNIDGDISEAIALGVKQNALDT